MSKRSIIAELKSPSISKLRYLVFILPLFWIAKSTAQELLPNTDFSDVNICCEYHVSCAPMGWWTCSGGTFNIEKNTFDRQGKLEYKPCLLRIKSDLPEHRSFIQAPILCQLDSGKEYKLSVQIKARDYLPKKLGILLSDSFIKQESVVIQIIDSISGLFRTYRVDSSLKMPADTLLELSKPLWPNSIQTIQFKFKAQGNEKFVVIGNFLGDETTELQRIFLHPKSRETLLEVHQVSLKATDNSIVCSTVSQLEYLETLNRRHTFYGACSDTASIDMNQLFSHWKKEENRQETTLEIGKHYRLEGVYFEFDKYQLLEESFRTLDSLVNILKENSIKKIRIEGHTDNMGEEAYNDTLSLNRAISVARYLLSQIPSIDIVVQGLGSRVPVANNDTEEGRAINRRVEIIFLPDEDERP